MDNKAISAIGRQFGSSGHEIGQRLAEELDISYYGKELITVTTRESGLCEDAFEKADERVSSGLSYAFTIGYPSFMGEMFTPYNDILSNDGLFKMRGNAVYKLAEIGSCVLIGRCTDYILRNDPARLSSFTCSSVESWVQKTAERHDVTVEEAKNTMEKTDKSRTAYYGYYMNKTWGMISSYNFSIGIPVLRIDETVELMKNFIERGLSKRPSHFG